MQRIKFLKIENIEVSVDRHLTVFSNNVSNVEGLLGCNTHFMRPPLILQITKILTKPTIRYAPIDIIYAYKLCLDNRKLI